MKHLELTNHIKGSYLKQQYLEAFLVQSAYIEGLLKMLVDFSYYKEVGNDKLEASKLLQTINSDLKKYQLAKAATFLYASGIIGNDLHQALNEYRVHRNTVMHDLLSKLGESAFEKDLRSVCEKGDNIISTPEFKKIAAVVDNIEKFTEQAVDRMKQQLDHSISEPLKYNQPPDAGVAWSRNSGKLKP